MKNLLQNLLIGFAFLLCALIAFQWVREAKMHEQLVSLTAEVEAKTGALNDAQGQLQRERSESERLDTLKKEMTETAKSNRLEISALKKDLEKAKAEAKQGEMFKFGLDQANESIKKQNDSIVRQNADMKKLMSERNDIATRLNKLTEEYNDLVKKWNEQQTKLAADAASTPNIGNPPPPSKSKEPPIVEKGL